jgi:uroporphyrinogen decarboxylase
VNTRERFLAIMSFEPVDRTLLWEFGYWGGALRRWYQEGLPKRAGMPEGLGYAEAVNAELGGLVPDRYLDRDVHDFFGFDEALIRIPLNNYVCPAYEPEVLEDHGDWIVWRDERGVVKRDRRDKGSLPDFVSWPVVTRDDWEQLKAERLRPTLEGRLPDNWLKLVETYEHRTCPLAIGGNVGFYGTPRYLLGDERILTMYYDDPDLMHDMVSYLADFWVAIYEAVLKQTNGADLALIWEDMSYKMGPLISPAMFREFLLPGYQKLTALFRDYGIKVVLVDTDGNCWKLIPLMVEGGVTGLYPFEVNAGMNVVEVREKYPRLHIVGGINKVAVAAGKAETDSELESKVPPMLRQGGYIPGIDHHVSADISWENFRYYRERLGAMVKRTS